MICHFLSLRIFVTGCLSFDILQSVNSKPKFSQVESSEHYGTINVPIRIDYDYSGDDGSNVDKTMHPMDQLQNCKRQDECTLQTKDFGQLALKNYDEIENSPIKPPAYYNMMPYNCRCDIENCVRYGDCCLGLIFNVTEQKIGIEDSSELKSIVRNPLHFIKRNNQWKCNIVQQDEATSTWALMISECPEKSKDLRTMELCSGDAFESSSTSESQKYLQDLPVYSKRNKILYKNIYCARCHDERKQHMDEFTFRFGCNQKLSSEELSQFQQNSNYTLGERIWSDGNVTCQLVVEEFSIENLDNSIPDIRYCGDNSIDSCPQNENVIDRSRALCGSYTQYVTEKSTGRIFKNPHCYICHGFSFDKTVKNLVCTPAHGKRKWSSADAIEGAGLNILFDFRLFNENVYVGYKTLCDESEVWNHVRQQCFPRTCGKGYVLQDGVCIITAENMISKDQMGRSEDEEEHNLNLGHFSEGKGCLRILIHKYDYTILADMNNTLVVNLSTGGLLYYNESEYEVFNDTIVSVCSNYSDSVFTSRFSPVFNYLSVVLLSLSNVFLFLHMIIYMLLPKLHNVPSHNLFCLTLSLFLAQFILIIFITSTKYRLVCVGAALTIHYFFLATFFWMNSISFDIWRTFAHQILILNSRRSEGRGAFWKYSVYSWGLPFCIVTFAVTTEFWSDFYLLREIQPAYGMNGLCWFSNRLSLFIFFALPVAVLILVNLTLFLLTARAIFVQNNEAHRVLDETKTSIKSSKHGDEISVKLYAKLALIMGLTWILGFIAALLQWDWLWYSFVGLNGLQGTFIFFAFDFKLRTLDLIREQLPLVERKDSSLTSS